MRRRPHSHCPMHSGVTWSASAICAWIRESSCAAPAQQDVQRHLGRGVEFWFIGLFLSCCIFHQCGWNEAGGGHSQPERMAP